MATDDGPSFWDAVRSWADDAGLLLPTDPLDPPKPKVPQAVCDSCPICQAAATLEQVNPQVLVDLGEVARSVITGLGSALTSASDQRTFGWTAEEVDSPDESDADGSGDASGDDRPGPG
jgi:hypothetical protein